MTEGGSESSSGQGPVTRILVELRHGTPGAREDLFRHVHAELKRIAGAYMRNERSGHTLQPRIL